MHFLLSSLLSIAALSLAAPLERRDAPAYNFDGDAPWSIDFNTLQSAIVCEYGLPTPDGPPPVLLVPGTCADAGLTWNNSYAYALNAEGYRPCYVNLPSQAGIDMQHSAEYVAYGLHYLADMAGQKTAVISHSQGGPDTQWALAWWPSLQNAVSIFTPLCPDFYGVTYAQKVFDTMCPGYECPASIWQQMTGSRFEAALKEHNFKAMVPTTTIWTQDDEVVTPPNQNALLPGATTIGIQDICPMAVVDHIYVIDNAAAYAIVIDALRHGGTADVARVLANNPTVCADTYAKKMSPAVVPSLMLVAQGVAAGFVLTTAKVPSEPDLASYVYGNTAN